MQMQRYKQIKTIMQYSTVFQIHPGRRNPLTYHTRFLTLISDVEAMTLLLSNNDSSRVLVNLTTNLNQERDVTTTSLRTSSTMSPIFTKLRPVGSISSKTGFRINQALDLLVRNLLPDLLFKRLAIQFQLLDSQIASLGICKVAIAVRDRPRETTVLGRFGDIAEDHDLVALVLAVLVLRDPEEVGFVGGLLRAIRKDIAHLWYELVASLRDGWSGSHRESAGE